MAFLRGGATSPAARPAAAAVADHYTTRACAFGAMSRRAALAAALCLAAAAPAWAGPPSAGLSPDPAGYVAPSRPFRTVHTALDLDIDLFGQRIAGRVTHTVESLRGGVDRVALNCVGLAVDSVLVDGRRAPFDYPVPSDRSTSWLAGAGEVEADDRLVIHMPKPLERGDGATVEIHYRGAPKIGLYWVQPEKGIPGKRHEVWSQGEGEDNRHWIPCHDYPDDKSTFEGRFRVPKGYTAISNGVLVGTREIGDRTEFHWKLDQPQVSYLIMLAVAKYRIHETKWRDVPVTYVVPPDTDDATILRGYGLTPDMMEVMSKIIGIDYPFGKYAQVVVQDFIYGGMENTTATVMNTRTLFDERTALTKNEDGLVAHELAHQWWGDMLTCREWSHMWLNEGFATYYAYLYKEQREGDDAFRYQVDHAHRDVINADNAEPRPMVVDFFNRTDARNNALVYVKGASVLHMLRFLLGDALYHETIRRYGEKFRHQVVETQDLARVVKDVTGENLDWFFEQWVYLAGHPEFRVAKSWDDATGMLRLAVSQTQKTGGLVPVFRVPVDVEISWEGGSRVHRVVVERAEQEFHFQVPAKPTMVVFDRGDWILKTLDFPKSAGELAYELSHGDYMTRVRAARDLGTKGADAGTVPALRAALLAGGHWGLRREAALSLGRIGNAAALDALAAGAGVEDARVRLACAEAMGSFHRDPGAASRLEKLAAEDRAWGVRAAAVSSLVKMRADGAERACLRALETSSDLDAVRVAGLEGLADLGDTENLERVKKYALPGNERVYRHPAIAAYAGLAKDLERDADRRRAAETLASMLGDWHLRTRAAVVDGLVTIGHPASLDALQRCASTDPVADVRDRARRAADRIAAAEKLRAAKTDTGAQVEELRRRIEELDRELDEIRRASTPRE